MTAAAADTLRRPLVGRMSTDPPSRLRSLAPYLLVTMFSALPAAAAMRQPLMTLDEGLLLVYPEQILAGDMPNRDFFTSYGPGGLSLLAGVYAVTGPSVVAERLVGLAYHIGIATGVYAMVRRLGILPAAVGGILAGLLMVPLGLGAYSWLGALALLTWSLALLDAPGSPWRTAAAGAVGALAVSWRPEVLLLFVAASVPHLRREHGWRPWGTGAVIGALPLAVHATLGGWPLWTNIVGRVGANSGLRVSITDIDVVVGTLATLSAAAYLVWAAWRTRTPRAVSWAALSLLVLPQMLQRLDRGHVLAVACVVIPLALAQAMSRRAVSDRSMLRFGERSAGRAAWAGAVVLLTLLFAQSLAASRGSPPSVVHDGRTLPVLHAPEKDAIDELLQAVDAAVPPGGRVFLGATDMSMPTLNDIRLYHLLPKHDAFGYYLELPPPQAAGSALLPDLRQADALVLREVPRTWGHAMVPFIPPGDDAANDLVARKFCLAERVRPYVVYLRCGAS